MTTVTLHLEIESFRVAPMGPPTANIWVAIGEHQFPQARWNDFAVVHLRCWNASLLRLVRRGSEVEKVDFMEGPYVVEVALSAAGELRFRGLKRQYAAAGVDLGEGEVAVGRCHHLDFINGVIRHSRMLLDACCKLQHSSADVTALESSLLALERAVKSS